jgi:hypothetical protein
MAKKKKKIDPFKKDKPKYVPYIPPKKVPGKCRFCNKKVIVEITLYNDKKYKTFCDEQLRICVFIDVPVKHDESISISGIDIDNGKIVMGRIANKEEKKYFRKYKTLNGLVPWCMIRTPHYLTCKKISHEIT